MLLLHQKAFGPVGADPGGQQNRNAARQQTGGGRGGPNAGVGISPLISWGAMERIYPRYPTIESIDLSDAERRMWMDLRPYVNTAPYVINGAWGVFKFVVPAKKRRCTALSFSAMKRAK